MVIPSLSLVLAEDWAKRMCINLNITVYIHVTSYSYSLLFASRGANVVVNDFNAAAAQKVVDEIVKGSALVHHCILGVYLNLDP